jgi:hypothetical protein
LSIRGSGNFGVAEGFGLRASGEFLIRNNFYLRDFGDFEIPNNFLNGVLFATTVVCHRRGKTIYFFGCNARKIRTTEKFFLRMKFFLTFCVAFRRRSEWTV